METKNFNVTADLFCNCDFGTVYTTDNGWQFVISGKENHKDGQGTFFNVSVTDSKGESRNLNAKSATLKTLFTKEYFGAKRNSDGHKTPKTKSYTLKNEDRIQAEAEDLRDKFIKVLRIIQNTGIDNVDFADADNIDLSSLTNTISACLIKEDQLAKAQYEAKIAKGKKARGVVKHICDNITRLNNLLATLFMAQEIEKAQGVAQQIKRYQAARDAISAKYID